MINIINSLLKSEKFNNEFVLNTFDKNIYKYLFYSKNIENNNYIFNLLLKYGIKNINKINNIFDIINYIPIHFGIDLRTNRLKIYVSLYNNSFERSLKIIRKVKYIIGIKDEYFLEKDFYKFDCIGIDILEKGFDLKIYELVKINNNSIGLPDFIKIKDIKEIGFLKNFNGRKKKFFRFNKKQDIDNFSDEFNIIGLDKIKYFLNLEKRVKYYCIEGDKKEIYFV